MDFPDLQPGLEAEITTVVDDSLVVKHTGGDGVFATQLALFVAICSVVIGCASTKMTTNQRDAQDVPLPKPNRVIVYSFAASPEQLPANSAIAGQYNRHQTAQTPEQVLLGQKLSDILVDELVEKISALGIRAEHAGAGPPPQLNDLLLSGAFVSIDKGSRAKRMLIGFGAGAGELKTYVEGHQVTDFGPRRIGSAEFKSQGGKMPGMLVPVAGGAAAGAAGRAAVISGGLNVAQEAAPETLKSAAKRTAKDITELIEKGFARRGWLPASKPK